MTPREKELLWQVVQQALVLRRVEQAMRLIQPVEGGVVMNEARYQRTIKDAGLVAEAKAIEEHLNGE